MIETKNKTYSEIKEYFNSSYDEDTMREMLRNYFSRNLMDTNQDNIIKCEFPLDSEESFGLSTLQMPWVKGMWQHQSEGYIMFVFEGDDYELEMDDLSVYELIQILDHVHKVFEHK